MTKIAQIIQKSIEVKERLLQDTGLIERIEACNKIITNAFEQGRKVLFCGNGGSASDAQHLAAEFSGRFYKDRPALPSEALHCNTSYLTAVANDYGFDKVYSRMIEGMGYEGDVLIALSTSGNSTNIIEAVIEARKKGMHIIGFTGEDGGKLKSLVDTLINIPSRDTPRIQESHIMIGHIICETVEENLFGNH